MLLDLQCKCKQKTDTRFFYAKKLGIYTLVFDCKKTTGSVNLAASISQYFDGNPNAAQPLVHYCSFCSGIKALSRLNSFGV